MHKRLLHGIVNMQENYPTTRIIRRKDYFKSAYWQQHLSAQAIIQLFTQINWKWTLCFLISLRLTFGEANGSAGWSTISKNIADLRSALLLDGTWEPRETQAPNQDSIPLPSTQYESILFARSKPLGVNITVDTQVNIDIYLDNWIIVIPNIGNNGAKENTEIPLAIHAVSRPLAQKELVPRDEIIRLSKAKSEGALEEIKVV